MSVNLFIARKRVLIVSLSFVLISCTFFENKKLLAEYESQSEKGKWFYINDDLDRAEESYMSALAHAEQMQWFDGIIIAKTHLGHVQTAKANRGVSDYSKVERTYLEAIEICLGNARCSKSFLGPVYDQLINLYLVKLKDIGKAEQQIVKVIEIGGQISEEKTIHERLSDYENQMRLNGFTSHAEKLSKQIENY
jgi:hypothetical protein